MSDLQFLLNSVLETFASLDFQINADKTVCMTIENRWRSTCASIVAGGKNLSWVDEVLVCLSKAGKILHAIGRLRAVLFTSQ